MEVKEIFYQFLNIAVTSINLVGVTIVLWGFVVAAIGFIRMKLHRESLNVFFKEANEVRAILAIYILFGLEFMIAADIIHTFIKPTQEDLIILGSIVAIRTVLSYFLAREVDATRRDQRGGK